MVGHTRPRVLCLVVGRAVARASKFFRPVEEGVASRRVELFAGSPDIILHRMIL